ncbi:Fic family protein [Roseateles sp.]|uniref:Fic family protein n=1 Tax=Roseateles sp. TaxID=1971397 RepID=UPI0031D1F1A9
MWPSYPSELKTKVERSLWSLRNSFECGRADDPGKISEDGQHFLEHCSRDLRHQLSDVLVSTFGWPTTPTRSSSTELGSLRRWEVDSADSFVDLSDLARLNEIVVGHRVVWRSRHTFIAGSKGSVTRLSDLDVALSMFKQLSMRTWPDGTLEGFVAAVIEFVCVNSYHPFADGNGRCSRILFNARMRALGLPENTYIPLKEMFWASFGGYEIRLRQVELHGDWLPMLSYFSDVISICAKHPHSVCEGGHFLCS